MLFQINKYKKVVYLLSKVNSILRHSNLFSILKYIRCLINIRLDNLIQDFPERYRFIQKNIYKYTI